MTEQERVERVAKAIYEADEPGSEWPDDATGDMYRDMARAAIAALTVKVDPRCAKCGHPKGNHPY